MLVNILLKASTAACPIIITGVRPEDERALASSRGVILLIFARSSAILVCGPLGK
jgi:hypothetical protein